MEVHAHAHTSRKKWSHYFWEFFMLFLAVTLGFFVENQREHYIEHRREKEYVKQLIMDLRSDTSFFILGNQINGANQLRMDSLIDLLHKHQGGMPTEDLYFLARNITRGGFTPQYTNRAFEQLKNSGGLRLIRNSAVLDSITLYYESLKDIDVRKEHRMQRLHNLFLANEELFDGWVMNAFSDSGFRKITNTPPLLSEDKSTWSRYVLRLSYFKSADLGILNRINSIFIPKAIQLIRLLKNEYAL